MDNANYLIKATRDKPYIFNGSETDIDYLESAKKYPELFIVSENAIFSWEMFKDFWNAEINLALIQGLDCLSISNSIVNSFSNKYHVDYPDFNAKQFGLSENQYLNIQQLSHLRGEDEIEFRDVHLLEYGYPTLREDIQHRYLFNKINLFNSRKNIISIELDYYSLSFYKYSQKPLYYGIAKALIDIKKEEVLMHDVMHYLQSKNKGNTNYIDMDNHENYYSYVTKSKPAYFDMSTGKIKLKNFLDPVIGYFNEKRINFSELNINSIENNTGILAIIFTGKKFSLEVAKEFVKVRDVISLHEIKDFSKDFDDIIKYDLNDITPLIAIASKQVDILDKSSGEENYRNWIKENLSFSFYPLTEEVNFYKYCLTFKLSPILEIDEEFENMYKRDILNMINELNDKVKIENKPK